PHYSTRRNSVSSSRTRDLNARLEHRAPLLSGARVLDRATPRAELAGRLLADLGAEVLKIEPPGGTPSRLLPPFSETGPRQSLYWAAVGVGKRSSVVDIDTENGRERLRALVA